MTGLLFALCDPNPNTNSENYASNASGQFKAVTLSLHVGDGLSAHLHLNFDFGSFCTDI